MSESKYQRKLITKLKELFPGCVIFKNDPNQHQGIPDLMILFGPCWAMLEVKDSEKSPRQPNQEHYVERLNELSFASFIFPENEEEVLDGIQRSFSDCWKTRIPES